MEWLYLSFAILSEVAATLSLRMASAGRPRWYAVVVPGYLVSFVLLSQALHEGLGIGVAYGVWTAIGVALTALLSGLLFNETLTRTMLLGILLVTAGVVLLEAGG